MSKIFLVATLMISSVVLGGEPHRGTPQSSPLDKSTYFQITGFHRVDNLTDVSDVDSSRYLDVRVYSREVAGTAANPVLAIDQINMMTKRLVDVKYAMSRVTSVQMTAVNVVSISGLGANGKPVILEIIGSFDNDARLRETFVTLIK